LQRPSSQKEVVLCSSHNEIMELLATGHVDDSSLSRSQMGIEV